MSRNGIRRCFAGWAVAGCLGLFSKPDPGALSKPSPDEGWRAVDFRTATCGYVAPVALTFSVPPGYVVRNPHHGSETGCFWGMEGDLNRALESPTQISFQRLEHGIFQVRLTENVGYDPATRRFTEEDQIERVLTDAGITATRVTRRSFARFPGLVITGHRPDGFELYMLYLARGVDNAVVLINYRTATPPTALDSANWQRFLDAIR